MTPLKKHDYYPLLQGALETPAKKNSVPDFGFNPLNLSGDIYRPVIDTEWIASNAKPVWPAGKAFAVCLTHDVDAVSAYDLGQNLRSIWKLIRTYRDRPLGESLRWILIHKLDALRGLVGRSDQLCRFEDWIQLEQSYGARSTFFFGPEHVQISHRSDCMYSYQQQVYYEGRKVTVSELINTLDKQGWEIGLHPSWSAHNDLDELRLQKQQVEGVLNHPIVSIRQHFLKYDPLMTPWVQSQAGFEYDSTLGFNDNVGFRRGTSYPFSCFDLKHEQVLPLLQIPLTAQDGALLLDSKGLRLDGKHALEYVRMLMERVKEVGGVLTLSWHPHTRNQQEFWKTYQQVLEMVSNEDPWFGTVGEIGKWWSEQSKIDLLKYSEALSSEKTGAE